MIKWFKEFLAALRGKPSVAPTPTPQPVVVPPKQKPLLARDLTYSDINGMLNEWYLSQVGVRETSYNQGPQVEYYQKTVDGVSESESWCMSYMQTGLYEVAKRLQLLPDLSHLSAKQIYKLIPIYKSESCMSVFYKTHPRYIIPFPFTDNSNKIFGCWFIQQQKADANKGHTGKVLSHSATENTIYTNEGNTDGSGSREGDGVYNRSRPLGSTSDKNLRGFVDVTAAIFDMIRQNAVSVLA